MSARQSVYVKKIADADGGESPNRVKPWITVEVRVYFPQGQNDEATEQLDEAYAEAFRMLQEQTR